MVGLHGDGCFAPGERRALLDRGPDLSPGNAERWRFSIERQGPARITGAAGHAFTYGLPLDLGSDDPLFDLGLPPNEVRRWASDWIRAMLCVPLLGGPSNVPLGVTCLASAATEPFWRSAPPRTRLHLNKALTRILSSTLVPTTD